MRQAGHALPSPRKPIRARGEGADRSLSLIVPALGLVAALALLPLAFLAWQSVHAPPRAGAPAAWTLAYLRSALEVQGFARLAGNTFIFSAGTASWAMVLGASLAWLAERTDVPMRRAAYALALAPLVVPAVLFAVAWSLLGSPTIGLVNLALRAVTGSEATFVNVYSLPGMVFVAGLQQAPLAFLLTVAALRSMDPSLEAAAATSGAGPLSTARRITLPLAAPALAAGFVLVFVRALESFEVPALLGLPAGIEVFTVTIYAAAHAQPGDLGLASAYGSLLVLVAGAGLLVYARLASGEGRFATIGSRTNTLPRVRLGRLRPAAGALLGVYVALVGLLPLAALAWSSLQPYHRPFSQAALASLSLDAYHRALALPALPRAAQNSAILALATAVIVVLLGALTSWVVARSRVRGRRALDLLASLPVAVPGIVLGLAIAVACLWLFPALYGTLWVLLIAYVTRFLPYGVRYGAVAILRIDRDLEHAAAASGADRATTFRRIVLPLMAPGLLAGGIYVALHAMRELSSSILLYGPGTEVLAIVLWELWEGGRFPELAALGVLLVGALVVVVALAQRFAGRVEGGGRFAPPPAG
jgi:iron(III) transport system permease protein